LIERGVHRRDDDVELGEAVVCEVHGAVRPDVALDPGEDAKGRQPLVRLVDLVALAADIVGVQARNGADGRRVVANREVLVAELTGGKSHLDDGLAAVRPRRVAMQVAADLVDRDERGSLPAERLLAQLRRAEGDAERGVDRLLVRSVGKRLQCGDIRLRPGRAQQLGAEALARRDDELYRDPFDGDAGGAVVAALEHRDDQGQSLELVQQRLRSVCGGDDREPFGGVSETARVARDFGPEGRPDRLRERPGAVEQQPPRRPRPSRRAQGLDELLLGLWPDPRHLAQASLFGRGAKVVERRDPERAADLDAALGADPEQTAEADQLRRQFALEVGELLDVTRFDELAQPALDAGADAAQLLGTAGANELRDRGRRRADHVGRAAVRANGVVLGVGELE
jgi:hypothetical protein